MTPPYSTQEYTNTIVAKATFFQHLIDKDFMFLTSVRIMQHKRVSRLLCVKKDFFKH